MDRQTAASGARLTSEDDRTAGQLSSRGGGGYASHDGTGEVDIREKRGQEGSPASTRNARRPRRDVDNDGACKRHSSDPIDIDVGALERYFHRTDARAHFAQVTEREAARFGINGADSAIDLDLHESKDALPGVVLELETAVLAG